MSSQNSVKATNGCGKLYIYWIDLIDRPANAIVIACSRLPESKALTLLEVGILEGRVWSVRILHAELLLVCQ